MLSLCGMLGSTQRLGASFGAGCGWRECEGLPTIKEGRRLPGRTQRRRERKHRKIARLGDGGEEEGKKGAQREMGGASGHGGQGAAAVVL